MRTKLFINLLVLPYVIFLAWLCGNEMGNRYVQEQNDFLVSEWNRSNKSFRPCIIERDKLDKFLKEHKKMRKYFK